MLRVHALSFRERYKDPVWMVPEYGDRQRLQPAYDHLNPYPCLRLLRDCDHVFCFLPAWLRARGASVSVATRAGL